MSTVEIFQRERTLQIVLFLLVCNMSLSFQYLIYFYIVCGVKAWNIDGGVFDWLWPHSKDVKKEIGSGAPLITVPFEMKTDDEKFLEEATKFTDIIKSSTLDTCQHKVILKIKTSCSSMTEEELAKMSVNLLNCQSAVDGRQTFPCTESMTLKQCTEKMDATMWNAYHMMNNRARAVCLSARRSQFQALSEMTVNKLMSAAHDQVKSMNAMVESQNRVEKITLGTINLIEKGNVELLQQQDQLKSSQKGIHDFISHNLHELVREKALIATGHKELLKMTQGVKEKIDETNKQLYLQSKETIEHHKLLLSDIEAIQSLTKEIFAKIDSSTDKLLVQHTEAAAKYQEALKNLIKINETVHYLLQLIDATRMEIDEKFLWMKNFLDITGIEISKISAVASHTVYLLIGMLFASFLNVSTLCRIILTLTVLINLFMTYTERNNLILNYFQLTTVLISAVFCISLNKLMSQIQTRSSIEYPPTDDIFEELRSPRSRGRNKIYKFRRFLDKLTSSLYRYVPSINKWLNKSGKYKENWGENYHANSVTDFKSEDNECYSPFADRKSEVSSESLVRDWLQNKVHTPPSASSKSSNSQRLCSAICRSSNRRCRNVSSRGSEYCFRHWKGSSEIG